MMLAKKQVPGTGPARGAGPVHAYRGSARWLRLARTGLAAAGAVLIGVIASLAIVLAVVTHLSQGGQYTVLGHPVMTVRSGAMPGRIGAGDLILDNPVTAGQAARLRPGQIASFRSARGHVIVTTRIVSRQVTGGKVSYATGGGPRRPAGPVLRPAADVVGTFSFSIAGGGTVLAAAANPLAPGAILTATITWLAGEPLYRRLRKAGRVRALTAAQAPPAGPAATGESKAA